MDLHFDDEKLPLAARLRPRTLEEFFGQEQIVGSGRLLRRAIQADQLTSIILSGPPGTGKTTLARIIAARTQSQFLTMNAVLSGIKDIRTAIEEAKAYRQQTNRRTILFVDEVHRWNKSQQDALLPWVEDGLFVLIGATTENPFFEVNRALLSRSRVFVLRALTEEDLEHILDLALHDVQRGYGDYDVVVTADARRHLVTKASGDARTLLNALELAVETSVDIFPPPRGTRITVDLAVAEDSIQQRALLYDKDGDYHFDTISAFIKSIRGSDPDAALYWLARMLEAGEDPHFIFRRLLIQASEDIGLADPGALGVVTACADAFDRVGLPEGRFHLAQATLYLATTEKSNSTLGLFDAIAAIRQGGDDGVPTHLKDPSRDGADMGHGKGYLYPHAYEHHWVAQRYLPEELKEQIFYHGGTLGWEGERNETIRERRQLQLAAITEEEREPWSVAPAEDTTSRWNRRTTVQESDSRALRDQLTEGLSIAPTDRVLLYGDAVQLLLWPIHKRASAGITSAWTDGTSRQSIVHTLGDRRESVYSPEVHQMDDVPDDAYPGPFDLVVYRAVSPLLPSGILPQLLSRLAENGVFRVVVTDIHEGDSPASILPLPGSIASDLKSIQREIYPPAVDQWREALLDAIETRLKKPDSPLPPYRLEEREVRHPVRRHLSPDVVASWLAEGTPLGRRAGEILSSDDYKSLRHAVAELEEREYPWTRVYRVFTVAPP